MTANKSLPESKNTHKHKAFWVWSQRNLKAKFTLKTSIIGTSSVALLALLTLSTPTFAQLKSPSNTAIEQPKKISPQEADKLVYSYCYAMQAAALCKGLQVRLDTEDKIEKILGGKFRGPEGSHNSTCFSAIMKANDDENRGICKTAWEKYGCYGSEIPRLIQHSSSMGANAATCPF